MGGFKGATTGALVQEKVELLRSEGVEVKEPRPGQWTVVRPSAS